MDKSSGRVKVYLALGTGLAFMCFSALLIKSAEAPGIVTTFYRMLYGALFLSVPFFLRIRKTFSSITPKGLLLAFMAGFCFACDMAFWSTGIVASNTIIPTILANTAPVWVGLGTMVVFKEKHAFAFWVGLLLAFTGVVVMLRNEFSGSGNIFFGGLMGLIAGLFYGTFIIIAQPGRKLLDTVSFLFISTLSSVLILLLFVLIFDYKLTGYDQRTNLIFISYGLGVQVISWVLVTYAQGRLSASLIAPTLLAQPVGTAVLGLLILREQLTLWHIAGGIIVLAGIYTVHFSRRY